MAGRTAEAILAERLAGGTISPEEYRRRLGALQDRPPPRGPPPWLVGAIVLVVLAGAVAGSWALLHRPSATATSCRAPALPGAVVDVRLLDMGAMMGGGMMRGRAMRVLGQPSVVPAGTVSFRAFNAGSVTHELVVLPLPPGGVGTRATGPDGRVSEAGSLGEASAPCGEGAGDGIRPGTWSWVSLELAAGSYELVCNLPGHYARGMYTELDVR
jgi:uncharacterized cupredoxin-like copper-binding protein